MSALSLITTETVDIPGGNGIERRHQRIDLGRTRGLLCEQNDVAYRRRLDEGEVAGCESIVAGQRPLSGAKRSFRWISRYSQNGTKPTSPGHEAASASRAT